MRNKVQGLIYDQLDLDYRIRELEVSITSKCHLRCDNCGFYIPDQPHPALSKNIIPEIETNFKKLDYISNALISVTHTLPYDVDRILIELAFLGCKAIEFNFHDYWNFKALDSFFSKLKQTQFTYFNVLLNHPSLNDTLVGDIIHLHPRIKRIKNINDTVECESQNLHKKNKPSSARLNINILMFSKSQKYNTGLNGKISIDSLGNVRNYKHHKSIYGNLCSDTLISIVERKDFILPCNINNDQILVCKDCQFRYVCVDFSEFIETKEGFKRLTKCEFIPYEKIDP